ncbi:DUF2461 domain-containing protein [Kordiimonas sp.]|uniref:DUF2461 domain-containing protein n=1 Tax=Kordiimonas sp. TaxID=1970157 RepID=UPI003A94C49C
MTAAQPPVPLFPSEGIVFLRTLAENNNREWFTAHKKTFEVHVKKPVTLLGEAIALGLEARLKAPMTCKVFRIYRDVRFSKDKTPFNCHIRMAFWPGGGKKARAAPAPAFYLSIEPGELICGAGAVAFSPEILDAFRRHIEDDQAAADLIALMHKLTSTGHRIDEPELKRTPSGFANASDETTVLLRRKSLSAWKHIPHSARPTGIATDTCLQAFETLMPLYSWMATKL